MKLMLLSDIKKVLMYTEDTATISKLYSMKLMLLSDMKKVLMYTEDTATMSKLFMFERISRRMLLLQIRI